MEYDEQHGEPDGQHKYLHGIVPCSSGGDEHIIAEVARINSDRFIASNFGRLTNFEIAKSNSNLLVSNNRRLLLLQPLQAHSFEVVLLAKTKLTERHKVLFNDPSFRKGVTT